MAQTTGAMSMCANTVDVSTNNSDWTALAGYSNSVTIAGGDRNTGLAYTFDGDTAIITGGKRTPLSVTVNSVYTEDTSGAFETIRAIYETACGGTVYVRWSPSGADTGDFRYTSDAGFVKNAPYPQGDAESGSPIVFTWTVETPKVTKAAVA